MKKRKVLVIGLDGYEQSFGYAMMEEGELPALRSLKNRSATWLLDHGWATRTGLAWEHFSTGLKPEAAQRWSPVYFNSRDYSVRQEGTLLSPFVKELDCKAVVFDAPYFNLSNAQNTLGIVNWGAHDPGVNTKSRPAQLHTELTEHFGSYPAKDWIYGITWQSVEKTQQMRSALVNAVNVRAEAAHWLLQERLPDWDLGIVVVGELHSATEAFWHGVDPSHPLHNIPSAQPAGEGLRDVYRATDHLVDILVRAFPDVTVVTFSMGGMGQNNSDVPCMVLLPEILYRKSFGQSLLQSNTCWDSAIDGIPKLDSDELWSKAVHSQILRTNKTRAQKKNMFGRRWFKTFSKWMQIDRVGKILLSSKKPFRLPMDWVPAMRYESFWPKMEAFVLPSFYDGRIRVNLEGREQHGIVPIAKYSEFLEEMEAYLLQCTDMHGEPVIECFEHQAGTNPLVLHPTAADLVIVWRNSPLSIQHPKLGLVGPVPYRRTGGHTGPYGMVFITNAGLEPGSYGVSSAFDVVPTIVQLLGESLPDGLSGQSLISKSTNSSVIPDKSAV